MSPQLMRALFPMTLPYRIHQASMKLAAPAKFVEVFTDTYVKTFKEVLR